MITIVLVLTNLLLCGAIVAYLYRQRKNDTRLRAYFLSLTEESNDEERKRLHDIWRAYDQALTVRIEEMVVGLISQRHLKQGPIDNTARTER